MIAEQFEFTDEEEETPEPQQPPRWEPPDPECPAADEVADWIVTRILDARAEQARIKQQYRPRLAQAEQREKGLLYRFGSWLECFTRARVGKRKSVLLASGTVGFRKLKADVTVVGAQAAADWARQHAPQLLAVTIDLRKAEEVGALTGWSAPAGTSVLVEVPAGGWARVQELAQRLPWLAERLEVEVDGRAAFAYFQETGELAGGCELRPETDRFYVQEPREGKMTDAQAG